MPEAKTSAVLASRNIPHEPGCVHCTERANRPLTNLYACMEAWSPPKCDDTQSETDDSQDSTWQVRSMMRQAQNIKSKATAGWESEERSCPTYLCYLADWDHSAQRSGFGLLTTPCSLASTLQTSAGCRQNQTCCLLVMRLMWCPGCNKAQMDLG